MDENRQSLQSVSTVCVTLNYFLTCSLNDSANVLVTLAVMQLQLVS